MKYRRLGRTALQVSEVCLGTMNFGPETSEDDSRAIVDHALELGINFFDTANRYGGSKGPGRRGGYPGAWLPRGGGAARKSGLRRRVSGGWLGVGGGPRGESGVGDEVLGGDVGLAERGSPVGPPHPRRV